MIVTDNRYDVAIIGGGISGLGVALAAIPLGITVSVFEKGEICSATSASSLRIIHGGFRYLQTANIARVIQSVKAQRELLDRYPAHIKPLPCIMPLAASGLKSKLPVSGALSFYSALYKFLTGKSHDGSILCAKEIHEHVPILKERALHGALKWWDAQVVDLDDFIATLLHELKQSQCSINVGTAVTGLRGADDGYQLTLADGSQIAARYVVNTTGAWIDKEQFWPVAPSRTHWALGFNIVLNRSFESTYGVGIQSALGRLFFLTPRGSGSSAIGTWYIPFKGLPDRATVSDEEIANALSEVKEVLPEFAATRDDVCSVEIGVLPMKGVHAGEPVLLGSEVIKTDVRYASVLSTKFTTFLSQGRAVLRELGLH